MEGLGWVLILSIFGGDGFALGMGFGLLSIGVWSIYDKLDESIQDGINKLLLLVFSYIIITLVFTTFKIIVPELSNMIEFTKNAVLICTAITICYDVVSSSIRKYR